jgi:hypothetical protein
MTQGLYEWQCGRPAVIMSRPYTLVAKRLQPLRPCPYQNIIAGQVGRKSLAKQALSFPDASSLTCLLEAASALKRRPVCVTET